jgi:diguanylate cyclase (GGDEF)-like protein
LALVIGQLSTVHLDQRTIGVALTLCGLGMAHTEIALRIERVRRRIIETPHVDFSSVWTFAGAVLLPPALSAVLAAIVMTHLWARSWRPRVPIFRHVFSTATIVLSCFAASAVMVLGGGAQDRFLFQDTDPLPLLVLAILAYTTVNSSLVAGAIAVSTSQPDLASVLGSWSDVVLEIATLSLGALVAIVLSINPWLVAFALPPLLVLHRAVLVHHLREAARTDRKTGLLNAAAWHTQAERALNRGSRDDSPRGVLVLDLDHFKRVNDTYGHLAGDDVLVAVADALRSEVRDRDLVGRFGGEEFVVLLAALPGGGAAELEAVAERMRRRVADLRVEIPTPDGPLSVAGLTVSIGGAVQPGGAQDLRTLLQIADAALYSAKRAGRNRVRMGLSVPTTSSSSPFVSSDLPAGGG